MKVLLVDCNSVRTDEQQKASELAKFKDIKLTLLAPSFYEENYKKNTAEKIFDPAYEISIGLFWGKHPNRAIFFNNLLKYIWKNPDIISVHSDENFFLTFQALLYKLLFSSKSKFVFHTWQNIYFDHKNFPQAHWLLYVIDSLIEKFVLKFSDACMARNIEAITIMKKKGFKGRLAYIPWGTSIDTFYKKDVSEIRSKFKLKGFVIGYIGRLVEDKGVIDLLNAIKNIKEDYTLLIVGDGPLKGKIYDIADENGTRKNIKLMNGVPFKEVPDLMNCIDSLVLPSITGSKWKEQFGRVIVEAMACEVPVIGSNSGAIPDVIGDAGLIFEEGNVEDLSLKIISIIQDQKLRKELGAKGRERVIQNFTWKKFAEKSHNLFAEIYQ